MALSSVCSNETDFTLTVTSSVDTPRLARCCSSMSFTFVSVPYVGLGFQPEYPSFDSFATMPSRELASTTLASNVASAVEVPLVATAFRYFPAAPAGTCRVEPVAPSRAVHAS